LAIANALQLEAARRHASRFPLKYDAMPSVKSLNLSFHCRIVGFLLLIYYFTIWPSVLTLWPWLLTVDLEHLQCISCYMMKLCTKYERNRAIHGRVIAISIFDLMTFDNLSVPEL